MTLASNQLQSAIFTRLTAQLPGMAIYDFVPQDSVYPYVTIGEMTADQWGTKTRDGQQFTVTIHAFDKAAGKKSVQAIIESVYAALHQQQAALTMAGFTAVLCQCEFSQALQDPAAEGDTDHYFHGVQRYRVSVDQN